MKYTEAKSPSSRLSFSKYVALDCEKTSLWNGRPAWSHKEKFCGEVLAEVPCFTFWNVMFLLFKYYP